uniref:phospholipase domain-containing protein n=6 Tax=Streptomyces TaxID=1883 RepID=UPI000A548772
GVRPARPLKYAPRVDAAAGPRTGTLTLTFASGGRAGAAFHVTSGNRTDGPWTYTTGAGRTVSDTWDLAGSGGAYDLTVHGPNGFLRVFRGPGTTGKARPEVTARHTGDDVELTYTNKGAETVALKVASAYGGRSRTVRVRPGATVREVVGLRSSHRWYDLTVTAGEGFLRRFAGHVENGRAGVSDPALGRR